MGWCHKGCRERLVRFHRSVLVSSRHSTILSASGQPCPRMAHILLLELEFSCSDSGFRGVSAPPAPCPPPRPQPQPSAPALWQAMPFPFCLLRLVASHLLEPSQGQPQPGQMDINPMDKFFSRNHLLDFSSLAAGLWVHLAGEI